MNLFEICGGESHPVYQALEVANGARQYDFIRSLVAASLAVQRTFLSHEVIRALNFQAITCLHSYAGQYRPCQVVVGNHTPPEHYRVEGLMDDFINTINRRWESADPLTLSAFVLWNLNYIHPFINGNGRTARAASYIVLCLKFEQWFPGSPILPELLRRERADYVLALRHADESSKTGEIDLAPLRMLIERLLLEQLNGSHSDDHGPAVEPQ